MTSPLAGKPAPPDILVDLGTLEHAYYERRPDMDDPGQRVAFGTSGHRGSSPRGAFNESHSLRTVLEVLAANGVETIVQRDGGVTPRRRSSRARSSCTTRAAPGAWPTVSSSRPRTTRPTTGASSTTRRTAAPLAPR
jgi:hypothetical protein